MNSSSCIHVKNYKAETGETSYRVLHAYFVSCVAKDAFKRKAKDEYCHDCSKIESRLHACLSCVYFGCFEGKHIHIHAQDKKHYLAMELKYGNIYCFLCGDYVYDEEFEAISKKQKKLSGQANGMESYFPWEPTMEEVELIKQNGGMKKILDNSDIGLRGLINLGHTCFMNCIVQVLVHTPLLRDYFLSDKHICENSLPETCLACEMSNIFQEFYSGQDGPHVPTRLVYLMWTHAEHLVGFHQQDAHEFLIAILDVLHKHCKTEDTDEGLVKRCSCIIDQIFTGFYQSDIVCLSCNHVSTKYDPFFDISLNLGVPQKVNNGTEQCDVSLLDCISRYTHPENLPISCTTCGGKSKTKQLTMKKLPIVTCFHLKRLEHSSGLEKKNTTHVIFPECLDMSPFMSSNLGVKSTPDSSNRSAPTTISNSENIFYLFAVVSHKGNMEGGHYVSYIRQRRNNWYQCNDDLISLASPEEVLASEGYLLFYHKQILEYGRNSNSVES